MFSDVGAGISARENRGLFLNLINWFSEIVKNKEKDQKMEQSKPDATPTSSKTTQTPSISSNQIEKRKDTTAESVIKAVNSIDLSTLSQSDKLYEDVVIIKELEEEIEALGIDDQGYKEILLTDMARQKGVDYAKVARQLENILVRKNPVEESDLDPKKEKQEMHKTSKLEMPAKKVQIEKPYQPITAKETKFIHEKTKTTEKQDISRPQMISKERQIIQKGDSSLEEEIKQLRISVDYLTDQLVTRLDKILDELKKKK